MNILFIILSVLVSSYSCSFAWAKLKSEGQVSQNFTSPTQLEFKVAAGFHFNKDAPTFFQAQNSKKKIDPKVKNEKSIVFDLKSVKEKTGSAQMYVCDDANTVCEPHSYKISLNTSETAAEVPKVQPAVKTKTSKPATHLGFILNDYAYALKKAKDQNKLLFIDFRGSWCPPCIRLEKEVFNQKKFTQAAQAYVLVSLDVDREEVYPLMEKYSIKAFPTLVVLNSSEEEIARFLDFQSLDSLSKKLKDIAKNEAPSFAKLRAAAQSEDKVAMFKLAEALFYAYKFEEALTWYEKSQNLNKNYYEAKVYQLEESNKDAQGKIQYEQALQEALKKYPDLYASVDWYSSLAKSYGEKHTEYKTLLQKSLEIADTWIQNPKKIEQARKEGGFTEILNLEKAELWAKKAEVYKLLADESKSKDAWQKAIDETMKLKPNEKKPLHIIYLTYYMKQIKPIEEVTPWMQKLEKAYPEEFTYPYRHSKLLFDAGQAEKALPIGLKAWDLAYGSNKFTVATLLAKIQNKLGQKEQAKKILQDLLDSPLASYPRNKRAVENSKNLLKEII